MAGAARRTFAILIVALGVTDCGPGTVSKKAAAPAVQTPAAAEPVYRYVSLGVTSADQQTLEGGRIGTITWGPPGRAIVNPDGSVELATPGTSEHLMGGVPIPARLGGGFLFWDDALYRARSFLAPLEPIVDLPTNALGIEFGPDYLLLLLPDSPPRAFALEPPQPLPLSPKGVIDVVAADDGRALALDAIGRALASTDAGKSWKDVTGALSAPARGVSRDGHEVAFVSRAGNAVLQADGQLVPQPSPARSPEKPEAKPVDPLLRAIRNGLPLSGQRAWVGEPRGTSIIDLHSGKTSRAMVLQPEGSNCFPVSLDEEGIVVCEGRVPKPTTTIISHALAAKPVIERTFERSAQVLAGPRGLSVIGGCSGSFEEGSICLRHTDYVWTQLTIPAERLKSFQVRFWAPRENGGAVAIVGERDPHGDPKTGLFDPETNRLTLWDAGDAQLLSNSARSRWESSVFVKADGSLHGFANKGTIEIDPRGHVSLGSRSFITLSSAGRHALARDRDEHLWQTNDYGAHWSEVARPPFDNAPEGTGAKANVRPSGRSTDVQCSLVGCVLDHSSGTGVWLRTGWPEDPPRAPLAASAEEVARAFGRVVVKAPEMPTPVLPQLHCATRSTAPLRVPTPPKQPEPKESGQKRDERAGLQTSSTRAARNSTELTYRDVFSADRDSVSHGFRGAVHFDAEPAQLAKLSGTRTPLQARFVEPFDLAGRTRQFSVSTGNWPSFDPRSNESRRERSRFDETQGTARPVLGSQPGRSGGVLLLSGGLSLFVSNNGQVRPIRPGCTAVSGYVDARGKRFVACAEEDASTHLEALDAPARELVRAAPAWHYRSREPGLRFFAPGEPTFLNPDAIGVGRDEKLAILRLPPGDEPPTVDNPAWLLRADAEPLALAPWSTLELATAAACAGSDGYRAIVQTGKTWFGGIVAAPNTELGMTALVRWSAERVCLEAIEVGFRSLGDGTSQRRLVSAVARFAGAQPGAVFIGTESTARVLETATCELGAR